MILKETMKTKANIITQELWPPSMVKEVGKEMKKYKYTLYSFFIQCSLKTALKRAKLRKKKTPPMTVYKIHKLLSAPVKGDTVINTEKLSLRQSVNIVLNTIKKRK